MFRGSGAGGRPCRGRLETWCGGEDDEGGRGLRSDFDGPLIHREPCEGRRGKVAGGPQGTEPAQACAVLGVRLRRGRLPAAVTLMALVGIVARRRTGVVRTRRVMRAGDQREE